MSNRPRQGKLGEAHRRKPSSNKRKRAQLDAARRTRHRRRAASSGRLANGAVMPSDAIAADLSKQSHNNGLSARLFYLDQPFKCVDCGSEEVWTARQQQWYYEVAKGSIYARAVRCRACRQARRSVGNGRKPRQPA